MRNMFRPRPRDQLRQREAGPSFFIPAYAIRRSVDLEDPESVRIAQVAKRLLGSRFHIYPPADLSVTSIARGKMIEKLREARVHPSAHEMTELALHTRDGFQDMLKDHPPTLSFPLGRLMVFGDRRDKLGFALLGWKGYRARYAAQDEMGEPLPLGTIVRENQFAVGAVTAAMADVPAFNSEGLVRTPHLTIASKPGGIRKHELRAIQDRFDHEADLRSDFPIEAQLQDPIIYLRAEQTPSQEMPIYVRLPEEIRTDTQTMAE